MNIDEQNAAVSSQFLKLGFKLLHSNKKPSTNGPDMWVIKDGRKPLSVEIKIARKKINGCIATEPVSKARIGDDLIAVIFNKDYVLIESMKDHLRNCSPKGTRAFTVLS